MFIVGIVYLTIKILCHNHLAQLHFPLIITVKSHEYQKNGLEELALKNFVTQRAIILKKINEPEQVQEMHNYTSNASLL